MSDPPEGGGHYRLISVSGSRPKLIDEIVCFVFFSIIVFLCLSFGTLNFVALVVVLSPWAASTTEFYLMAARLSFLPRDAYA